MPVGLAAAVVGMLCSGSSMAEMGEKKRHGKREREQDTKTKDEKKEPPQRQNVFCNSSLFHHRLHRFDGHRHSEEPHGLRFEFSRDGTHGRGDGTVV